MYIIMKAVIQRVKYAQVEVDKKVVGKINEGFLMMQESVYSKLTLNSEQKNLLLKRIKKNVPNCFD